MLFLGLPNSPLTKFILHPHKLSETFFRRRLIERLTIVLINAAGNGDVIALFTRQFVHS